MIAIAFLVLIAVVIGILISHRGHSGEPEHSMSAWFSVPVDWGIAASTTAPMRAWKKGIVCYLTEIERWNRRFNLVKAHGEDLVVRHLLDSLVALPLIRELDLIESIADIGSGAGFSGSPLPLPGSRIPCSGSYLA